MNADRSARPAILFAAGIVGAIALAIALAALALRAPAGDIVALLQFLSVSGLTSLVIGLISYRLGWWRRLRSLRWAVTLGQLLAVFLIFLNVWITARLMFISKHDLELSGLLLLFAGGIAMAFGFALALVVTGSLRKLARGAEAIAQGNLSTRVPVEGNDEVAALAAEFNHMAAQLEAAAALQQQVDTARRDLIAWASHDLRTPLASIRAMVEALADGVVSDPAMVDRYLRQTLAEVRNLSRLIDDLFELAQLDAGRLDLHCEPSSLSDLISDTLESLQVQAAQKGIELTGQVQPGADPVWMAPDKIQRVLTNLVDNALRHTPAQGQVVLEAHLVDGSVQVEVRDTGEGIGPADLPHVFDRFYRGESSRSRATGGAGLGLAIAKGLVEAHGGHIWAESQPGRGATFSFMLPKVPVGL